MPEPALTYVAAHDLAGDLLRQLATHPRDREGVSGTLLHWFEVLGANDAALICAVALQRTFAECMTPAIEPAGALEFHASEGAAA